MIIFMSFVILYRVYLMKISVLPPLLYTIRLVYVHVYVCTHLPPFRMSSSSFTSTISCLSQFFHRTHLPCGNNHIIGASIWVLHEYFELNIKVYLEIVPNKMLGPKVFVGFLLVSGVFSSKLHHKSSMVSSRTSTCNM